MSSDRHNRVLDVFAAASEMGPKERDSYLTRACENDDTLRNEVESLFKYHDERTLIDAPIAETRKLATAETKRPSPDTSPTIRQSALHPILMGLLLFLGLLVASAFWVHYRIKHSLENMLKDKLQTILNADVAALEQWIERQKADVVTWAKNSKIQQCVSLIQENRSRSENSETKASLTELRQELWQILHPVINREGYQAYGVISRDGIFVAGSDEQMVGASATPTGAAYISQLNIGEVIFAIPSRERKFVVAIDLDPTDPTFAVAAPVCNDQGDVIGALSFGFDADDEFTRILSLARLGETGENYAFDKDAVLLSDVGDRQKLEDAGLLSEGQSCALNLEVREPGPDKNAGNTDQGKVIQPLTWLAAHAIAGERGTNVTGYRNYLGEQVIGSWTWLEDYQFGVGTEISYAEAYKPLRYIIRSFSFLIGVVVLLSIGIATSSYKVIQLQNRIEAQQYGSYRLGEKLGEGGMGQVFRAYHDRLHRPAAIKLLNKSKPDQPTIARFEREVQLTCKLTHPNTIQVYDYGVSTGGVFYYAMELLDGFTLRQIVEIDRSICAARTIFLLQQVCGSLHEAHEKGLIHRDIKPANIMVSERAGLSDFVKVLDFGIAKPIDPAKEQNVTQSQMIIGTPHFMAPERVMAPDSVDGRSDLFSLAAVAFFLLTGKHPFEGSDSIEILRQSVTNDGLFPSKFSDQGIPSELDQLVASCLSKDPKSRPNSALEMQETLREMGTRFEWTQRDAKNWWKTFNQPKVSKTTRS